MVAYIRPCLNTNYRRGRALVSDEIGRGLMRSAVCKSV